MPSSSLAELFGLLLSAAAVALSSCLVKLPLGLVDLLLQLVVAVQQVEEQPLALLEIIRK